MLCDCCQRVKDDVPLPVALFPCSLCLSSASPTAVSASRILHSRVLSPPPSPPPPPFLLWLSFFPPHRYHPRPQPTALHPTAKLLHLLTPNSQPCCHSWKTPWRRRSGSWAPPSQARNNSWSSSCMTVSRCALTHSLTKHKIHEWTETLDTAYEFH